MERRFKMSLQPMPTGLQKRPDQPRKVTVWRRAAFFGVSREGLGARGALGLDDASRNHRAALTAQLKTWGALTHAITREQVSTCV